MPSTELGYKVVLLPEPLIKEAIAAGPLWRAFGNRILTVAKDRAPVGETGQLKTSMGLRFQLGVDPRILVGSALTVGDAGVNLLGLILLGTDPHPIEGNPVLAFEWHGEMVFFTHVDHPGTKKNPFVQEAMKQVVHEFGGFSIGSY